MSIFKPGEIHLRPIDENALKAREMGLSYGIYMAMVRSGNT